jgi:hypothetical protein
VEKTNPKSKRAILLKTKDSQKPRRISQSAKTDSGDLAVKVRNKGWALLPGVASIIFFASALCPQPWLLAQAKASVKNTQGLAAGVPFVGCKSDGQVGPVDAPKGKAMQLAMSKGEASHLAYYKSAEGSGVLAPRGWYCFGTYGSSGATLYVSPHPIDSANLFSPGWKGFTGPAIELAAEDGDTSGRFGVARVIARVFPAHKAFARKVIEEGIEPPNTFAFGPYPKDKLNYKSPGIVEYQTPARADGLGTSSWLQKNDDPISGVAILMGETPDLLLLSARLPSNLVDLTPAIIQQVEREAAHSEF